MLHISSNTFHQQKCFVFVAFVCLSVCHTPHIGYLSFTQYWNAVESTCLWGSYYLHQWMGNIITCILLTIAKNWELLLTLFSVVGVERVVVDSWSRWVDRHRLFVLWLRITRHRKAVETSVQICRTQNTRIKSSVTVLMTEWLSCANLCCN